MEKKRIYIAQFVVMLEDQWFMPNTDGPPIRVDRRYQIEAQLFTAADAEDAYRTASDWLPGFTDSNHDGPGEFSLISPVGIHQIEDIVLDPADLPTAITALYGVSVGVYDPRDVDAGGIPLVRAKEDLDIFKYPLGRVAGVSGGADPRIDAESGVGSAETPATRRVRQVRRFRSKPLSIKRGFAIVLISGMVCSLAGGGIGYALARCAPFYYRGVFRGGESPDFHPMQVGVGLGVTQGLIAGLIVGSVVVLAVAFAGTRGPGRTPLQADDEVGQPRPKGCLVGALWLLGGSAASFFIGLVIGLLMGEYGGKNRRFDEERAIISPVLAQDPATSGIDLNWDTADGVARLDGEVATDDDLEQLRSRMKALLGEARIKERMSGVSVRGK